MLILAIGGIVEREDIVKKIFFGWYIVAAAMVFSIYNSTLFGYGFTAFLNPISATYGWTFAQISLASSIRGLEIGALDPFVGMASDRWPARRLILTGIIMLALGIFCFSRATNLTVFYAGFVLAGLGGAMGVSMVPTTVVSRWFKRNLGKASGILSAGVAMGGLFAPLIVKGIDAFGWQDFMMYLAGGILVLGLPLSFVFRNRPRDYGMVPDGKEESDVKGAGAYDTGMELKQALKTRTFWFIGISQMLQVAALHSIAIHQMPYLTSLGIGRSSAALAVSVYSMVGLVARLLYGVVADIFPKKYVLAISNGITAIGLIIFGLLDGSSFSMVAVFAVICSIGASGTTSVRAPIIREYFGVKNFGGIFGAGALMLTLGAVIGAPIAGWVYDTRGVYDPIWFIFAGCSALGMILYLLLPNPAALNKGVHGRTAL